MKHDHTRYNIPRDLKINDYGHLLDIETDPYSILEFACGSADDFICFDYGIAVLNKRPILALHAVVNSETGSFIEDFGYAAIDGNIDDPTGHLFIAKGIDAAIYFVWKALGWLEQDYGPDIRHDRIGWNQDPYYFARAVGRALITGFSYSPEDREKASLIGGTRLRFGGKRANQLIESHADGAETLLLGALPITRVPTTKERTRG
jgi:hypothetical protein